MLSTYCIPITQVDSSIHFDTQMDDLFNDFFAECDCADAADANQACIQAYTAEADEHDKTKEPVFTLKDFEVCAAL